MLPLRRLLASLALVLCASLAHAQAYTSIVVIGDSLSDTGNDTNLSTAKYTAAAAVPAPPTGYTQGRFTDGLNDTAPAARLYSGVWIEQLAAALAAQPKVVDSLDGGSNYAYGFAFTGSGTSNFTYGPAAAPSLFSISVNNMGTQLASYLATKPTITSKTLFVVWGGANDILNATSSAAIVTAASNEVAIVQQLIAAGATDIIIPNLPPLGAIPRVAGQPATQAALTAAAAGFNQALAAGLATLPAANTGKTLHLFPVDVFSLFNSVIATPASYNFTNVTASSQGNTTVNPDTYLFWDGLHPTTAGHHQLALLALSLIAPTSTTTTLTATNLAANLGASVTFTAKVASNSGSPTGVVTFYDGTTALGNGQLTNGTATFTTTTLTAGTHNISATYIATQYFNASNSNTLAEVVTSPSITASITPIGLTVASGASGTATVSVATAGGLSGTVTLGCGPLPTALSCSFSPSTLVFAGANNTLTSTLTVNTGGARITSLTPARPASVMLQTIAACSLLPLFGFLAFRRPQRGHGTRNVVLFTLFLLFSFGAVTGLSGCGSGTTSGASTGNYSVPVTVTGGGISTSTSFMLTVTK